MEDFILNLLEKAVSLGATDIHFNLQRDHSSIEFRRFKRRIEYLDIVDLENCYRYLKYKANLDLAQTLLPQSGSFTYIVGGRELYLRFSAIETLQCRNGVLRILNATILERLEDCTNDPQVISAIEYLLNYPHGLLLFAGSTGSGKSTSLFCSSACLKNRTIYSLEDPIERIITNIAQIQINPRIGLDFEVGLTQLLRHDPDVIIIGELRRKQEVQSAIRCSLTGHLVLSTLHSGSIDQVVFRLLDFGLKPYEIEHALIGIVFQAMNRTKEEVSFAIYQQSQIRQVLQKARDE